MSKQSMFKNILQRTFAMINLVSLKRTGAEGTGNITGTAGYA